MREISKVRARGIKPDLISQLIRGTWPNPDSGISCPASCGRETEMSENETGMKAELERLRAENQALKKTSSKGLSLKVSEKGALSVYGMGRFPVTLYKEQWLKLLEMSEDIRAFIQANDSSLKAKEVKTS